ncbi:flagellar export chaperone FlgN [Candidatus Formimonas warabiya]|nr:flagellar export chaperone FlgN [Candidatus Formimonas warabiya]
MTEHLVVLETKLREQMGFCRDLHKLVLEQRTFIKNRDLKGLEEVTASLEATYKNFSAAQTEMQGCYAECLNAMGLAPDVTLTTLVNSLSGEMKRRLSELVEELSTTIKKFHRDNTSNLMLIKNLHYTIGQVLKFYQTGNHLLYQQNGNIKTEAHTTVTLNKTV